jgi:hypothetical protein
MTVLDEILSEHVILPSQFYDNRGCRIEAGVVAGRDRLQQRSSPPPVAYGRPADSILVLPGLSDVLARTLRRRPATPN